MEDPRIRRGFDFAKYTVLRKLFLFLAAGLPGIALAVPLNFLFVTRLGMPVMLAYALVLVFQVSLNFFFCRWFVFSVRPEDNIWKQYGAFLSGILFFRLGDWALYSFLTATTSIYFLYIQIFNVLLFSLLKFRFARGVMEKG